MQFVEDLISDVRFLKVAVWCLVAFDLLLISGYVLVFFWVGKFNWYVKEEDES